MGSRILTGVIALALCAPVLAAEPPAQAVYVGVLGGGHFVLDDWTLGDSARIRGGGPDSSALAGIRIGGMATRWLGLEGTISFIPTQLGNESMLAMDYGFSVLLQPFHGAVQPYLVLGGGLYQSLDEPVGADIDFEVHLGIGFRAWVHRYVALRFEGRSLWTDAPEIAFNIAAVGGLDIMLWRRDVDRDGDGLPDSEDRCPDDAGPKNTDGCPDRDKDGIADKDDACPDAAGPAQHKGCPDRDGDGIIDGKDACPDQAGIPAFEGCPDTDGDGIQDKEDACPKAAGDPKYKGCPDTDGDGLPDPEDKCPKEAGPKSNGGCPNPDSDGDGIPDKDDRCPKKPGVKEERGCPPRDLQKFTGAIKGIQFESGSAKIVKKSFKLLDQAAKVLGKYKTINVTIEGHTDDQGGAAANLKLSKARAESVKRYLMEAGVDVARLEAVGYGETKPVASNKTKRGRAQNRRIEFRIRNR